MVEQKPSKLTMRVRFPSPAPVFCVYRKQYDCIEKNDEALSVLLSDACPCSSVVEHSLGKGEVTSSILVMGSIGQFDYSKLKRIKVSKRGTDHGEE